MVTYIDWCFAKQSGEESRSACDLVQSVDVKIWSEDLESACAGQKKTGLVGGRENSSEARQGTGLAPESWDHFLSCRKVAGLFCQFKGLRVHCGPMLQTRKDARPFFRPPPPSCTTSFRKGPTLIFCRCA